MIICAASDTRSVEKDNASAARLSWGFDINKQRLRTLLIWGGVRLRAFAFDLCMCIYLVSGEKHTSVFKAC